MPQNVKDDVKKKKEILPMWDPLKIPKFWHVKGSLKASNTHTQTHTPNWLTMNTAFTGMLAAGDCARTNSITTAVVYN
jgi:hypothetical protein